MRKSRRFVRTFEFDRIFLFAAFICFAVALTAILLSVSEGKEYVSADGRTMYFVAYSRADGDENALSLSRECRKRGGAGYIFSADEVTYVIAAAYPMEEQAETVAAKMEGGEAITFDVEELRLEKSDEAKALCETFEFCLFSLIDELNACAEETEKRNISEAAALKKCELLKADVDTLCSRFVASDTASSAVKSLTENVSDALDNALNASGSVSPRLRYAVCALAELAKNAAVAVERE